MVCFSEKHTEAETQLFADDADIYAHAPSVLQAELQTEYHSQT